MIPTKIEGNDEFLKMFFPALHGSMNALKISDKSGFKSVTIRGRESISAER
jgi:hypothetical protein